MIGALARVGIYKRNYPRVDDDYPTSMCALRRNSLFSWTFSPALFELIAWHDLTLFNVGFIVFGCWN